MYDISLVEADHPVSSYWDLIRTTVKRPAMVNVLRAWAYPLVKLIPSLRQTIVVVAAKSGEPRSKRVERW